MKNPCNTIAAANKDYACNKNIKYKLKIPSECIPGNWRKTKFSGFWGKVSQKNKELFELLELQKSLVYFTTSLRANEGVFEKMMKSEKVKRYPDDEDLLEDVIIENKQAMEMANIYNGILSGMVDTFASVISNNLNIVMKFLATVTIVMSIPTMIASFYGMNVPLPGHDNPYGFYIVLGFALLFASIVAIIFHKKDVF